MSVRSQLPRAAARGRRRRSARRARLNPSQAPVDSREPIAPAEHPLSLFFAPAFGPSPAEPFPLAPAVPFPAAPPAPPAPAATDMPPAPAPAPALPPAPASSKP